MMYLQPSQDYALSIKFIEWTRQFLGHPAAQETPCPIKDTDKKRRAKMALLGELFGRP